MGIMDNVSDGYHTFGELYEHRTALFAALCNTLYDIAYKTKLHEDGTMFEGMFLAALNTPTGWISYHCDMKYWGMFDVPERERALPWDGHTPEDVVKRLFTI